MGVWGSDTLKKKIWTPFYRNHPQIWFQHKWEKKKKHYTFSPFWFDDLILIEIVSLLQFK